ncbi:glycosyltransferase family 2 protein [Thalassovita sp.]|uniref:glycosyltransferase family 2 protein n=1 Tax=Thalassovita sp. TaxID=1979401 RepID=UPI0029DE9097|nr:glycosyltransferase family 2 protein [Thalassovita sp.]
MQSTVAVVTMVRDDLFFLKIWLDYYGRQFGRENLYIVNHGRGDDVARLAQGCNVIGIPGDPHKNFDMKRWRLLNNLVMGLRSYYAQVIVGDVDELVIMDPDDGRSLLHFLQEARVGRVLTPLGLEVIHRIDQEDQPITDTVLGPRRHVRLAPHYSKPCVISVGTKIARGGHFTQFDKLFTPDNLYLLHLKFCDFGQYVAAMDRRNAVAQGLGDIKDVGIGRHWFTEARGEDRALFNAFTDLEMLDGFDMRPYRKKMQRSFGPRGDTGYFHFDRPDYGLQFVLPERFNALF